VIDCPRCGLPRKDVAAHVRRVHPESTYMRPDEPRPHPMAEKITIEYDPFTREMTIHDGEWHTERYGSRHHGWFIPVEVPDNQLEGDE
jgi:hypothetical protein